MQAKNYLILLLYLFVISAAVGRKTEVSEKVVYQVRSSGKKIVYKKGLTLSTRDFKIKKKEKVQYAAYTTTSINFKVFKKKDSLRSEVTAIFLCKESYLKEKTLQSKRLKEIMEHENIHFAITAIYAARLQDQLDSFLGGVSWSKDKMNKAISKCDKLYNMAYKENRKKQKLYDLETKHSRDEAAQKKWNELVATELQVYNLK